MVWLKSRETLGNDGLPKLMGNTWWRITKSRFEVTVKVMGFKSLNFLSIGIYK